MYLVCGFKHYVTFIITFIIYSHKYLGLSTSMINKRNHVAYFKKRLFLKANFDIIFYLCEV